MKSFPKRDLCPEEPGSGHQKEAPTKVISRLFIQNFLILSPTTLDYQLLFSSRLHNAIEGDLVGNLRVKIESSLSSANPKGIHLFTHTDELLEEFNNIEEVRLDNCRNLFLIYFGFTFSILVVLILVRTKKSIKSLLSRLPEIWQ